MRKSPISAVLAGLGVVLAAALLALLAATATATTPREVRFTNTMTLVGFSPGRGNNFQAPAEGNSEASGAVTGKFTVAAQATIEFSRSPQSTHFETIHAEEVFTSATNSSDTITIDIQAQVVSASPDGTEASQGHWTIITGTGSYTDLHGGGTYDATIDTNTQTIAETLTGFAFYSS